MLGGDVAGFCSVGHAWFAMLRVALGLVCDRVGCVCEGGWGGLKMRARERF